jgi:hypothetical protein
MTETADIVVMCGDLTDYGLPEEARVFARELGGALKLPIVAVFGNPDYESGHADEIRAILADAGVRVLDGDGPIRGGCCQLASPVSGSQARASPRSSCPRRPRGLARDRAGLYRHPDGSPCCTISADPGHSHRARRDSAIPG